MVRCLMFLEADGGPSARDPFARSGDAAADAVSALCPSVVWYCQTRSLAEQIEADAAPAFAGVAELWLDLPEAAGALADAPERLGALWREDVRVAGVVVGRDHVIMRMPAARPGHIKGVFPFRRRRGLDVAAFQRYWLRTHGPIAALTEKATAYVQCHPLVPGYGDARFDGVTEIYWPDARTARDAMASRQMREDQAGDARNFADPDSIMLFLAAEEQVIAP